MTIPSWVKDAVFYQIFPDRFRNGDPTNDPPNLQDWGANPTNWGFHGGDLRGVINKMDYLQDLGINAIYLNPIFLATSNHRYNTSDYYKIDPKLGQEEDFLDLLDVAHHQKIRVVIDGVFNHCGRGFFAFNDVLENHNHSPYIDWFHLKTNPPDAYSSGEAEDYAAWWKLKSLPKFNTDNPQVRDYIFNVARFWIRMGVDGWRLDVPNEIDDDSFWEEFRQIVKSENPEAYLVGEIWDGDPRWVGEKSFDGLMNYPIRDAIIELLTGSITTEQFSQKINLQHNRYDQKHLYSMYNLLGSHDTKRIKTELEGRTDKLRLAYQYLMAYPGAPAIYYGDEIGMDGGIDPECRKAFPWVESQWDWDLKDLIQNLISIRKEREVLRRGIYQELFADGDNICYAFARITEKEKFLMVMNPGDTQQDLNLQVSNIGLKNGNIIKDLLSGVEYSVAGSTLSISIEPWKGLWLA